MRIVSFNVNGLRSIAQKGLAAFLDASGADVVGVQEARATLAQVPPELAARPGWNLHVVASARPGYSGVALFSRRPPDRIETSLGAPAMDREGRIQVATFGALTVANVYFPNGNGADRDNSRIPFKLRFTRRVFAQLEAERKAGARIVVIGDYNLAPEERDLARPESNRKTSGFTDEERKVLRGILKRGWVDAFRHFEPGEGHYTWWSQRFGVRARNVGWRIDHALVSPGAMPFLRGARIHADVMGSDHAPLAVDFDDAITDAGT